MLAPLRYDPLRVDRLCSCLSAALDELDRLAGEREPASAAAREARALLARYPVRLAAIRRSWFGRPGPSPELTVLSEDGRGDGRIVVALGSVTTADRVAVLVPGMGTTRANIGLQIERARRIEAEAERLAPELDTAVIVWLGYDAPDHPFAAASRAPADEGSAALVGFLRAIDVEPDEVTLIGNSYGSVVVGAAMSRGAAVDAVVLTGSPGAGARSTAGWDEDTEVYVEQAPGDVVGLLGAFGGTPPATERFGATRLAVNGAGHPRVAGHVEYFDERTMALQNVAAVVTGETDALVTQAPLPAGPLTTGFERLLDGIERLDGIEDVTVVAGAGNLAVAGIRTVEGWVLGVRSLWRGDGRDADGPG